MKSAKIVVLGIAGTAAAAAVWLTSGLRTPPPAVAPLVERVVQTTPTDEVLVAANELPVGTLVNNTHLRWQAWPTAALADGMIVRSKSPNAIEDVAGSVARLSSLAGEPIVPHKMVKGPNAGFLAALLPSGMRAVAINIASSGARSAGGFILPHDRVDILRTYRDDEATRARNSEVYSTETILQNVKILAIGQRFEDRGGERVVTGETATLELEPRQAELVMLAQRSGELSLALRSLADANKPPTKISDDDKDGLTVVRFGVSQQSGKR
jgi:pilus assembly protein CpaB